MTLNGTTASVLRCGDCTWRLTIEGKCFKIEQERSADYQACKKWFVPRSRKKAPEVRNAD